jgi:hypothetical protein
LIIQTKDGEEVYVDEVVEEGGGDEEGGAGEGGDDEELMQNTYYDAKAAKEDDINEALELFQTVIDMEEDKGIWFGLFFKIQIGASNL